MHEYLMQRNGRSAALTFVAKYSGRQFQMCLGPGRHTACRRSSQINRIENYNQRSPPPFAQGFGIQGSGNRGGRHAGAHRRRFGFRDRGNGNPRRIFPDRRRLQNHAGSGLSSKAAVIAFLIQLCGVPFHKCSRGNDGTAYFESKVRPILVEHCYDCHSRQDEGRIGPGFKKPAGRRAVIMDRRLCLGNLRIVVHQGDPIRRRRSRNAPRRRAEN